MFVSMHCLVLTLALCGVLLGVDVLLMQRATLATMIASLWLPSSVFGTFGIIYRFGYSLDTLSLMALTLSVGFIVDDAIVMLENISRHREAGMPGAQAASFGAREIGPTVLSMTLALVALLLPIL